MQFVPDPGTLDLSGKNLTQEENAAEDVRLRGVIKRSASDAMERESESMVSAYATQMVVNDYFVKRTAEEINSVTHGQSQMWLDDEFPTVDPDLVPASNVSASIMKFRQHGDTVYAYNSTNKKVIQEYQGYVTVSSL